MTKPTLVLNDRTLTMLVPHHCLLLTVTNSQLLPCFLLRDAMQSAVMRLHVACPSVCPLVLQDRDLKIGPRGSSETFLEDNNTVTRWDRHELELDRGTMASKLLSLSHCKTMVLDISHDTMLAYSVLKNFWGLDLPGMRTRTCSSRTRTRTWKLVLEDKDFPRGQQHWSLLTAKSHW